MRKCTPSPGARFILYEERTGEQAPMAVIETPHAALDAVTRRRRNLPEAALRLPPVSRPGAEALEVVRRIAHPPLRDRHRRYGVAPEQLYGTKLR